MKRKRSPGTDFGTVFDHASKEPGGTTADSDLLGQIIDLNSGFLDLLVTLHAQSPPAEEKILGLGRKYIEAIGILPADKRQCIAQCPYALYELRIPSISLPNRSSGVAEPELTGLHAPGALIQFARSALTDLWLLARTKPMWARLVHDMTAEECAGLAALTPLDLEQFKIDAHNCLLARLSGNPRFWPDLIELAGHGTSEQFDAARLAGVQRMSDPA